MGSLPRKTPPRATNGLESLARSLESRREHGLFRSLTTMDRCGSRVRIAGRERVNLASNDYLGLSSHPRLSRAVEQAAQRWGVGAGSSALVAGHLEIHDRLEKRFAQFKHAEAALICPTGFMANLAAVTALAGAGDVVLLDKLCHASLIDAARASGAQVRVFPHRGYEKLERLLERYADARRRIILTDSVFSMDGDCADLPRLCDLRDRYEALLLVDEAHGTGVLGETGGGLAELQGVAGRADVTVSTCGKALGCLGGVITGPRIVIESVVNFSRSYIYATAATPPQAAAIDAALDVLRDEPQLRRRLASLSVRVRTELRSRGWPVPLDPTPIIPLIVGGSEAAMTMSRTLEEKGFLVPAIRPPTVAAGTARLRVSLRADLAENDVVRLIEAVGEYPQAIQYARSIVAPG